MAVRGRASFRPLTSSLELQKTMMNKTKYYQMQIYNDEQIWFDYLTISILLDNGNGHLIEGRRLIWNSSPHHRANRFYWPGGLV